MKTALPIALALLAAGCILEPVSEPEAGTPRRAPRRVIESRDEAPAIQRWPAPKAPAKEQDVSKATPAPAPSDCDKPFEWPANGFPARTPKGNYFIGPPK